jgi:hypothetical protein
VRIGSATMPVHNGPRASTTSIAGTPAPAAGQERPLGPGAGSAALDSLLALVTSQRQLEAFRQRAEARRDAVDPAVYARVTADYQARLAALQAEADPLRRQLRAAYETLEASCARLRQRLDQARLDKDELAFRRDLGELDEPAFAERVEVPAAVLTEGEAELSELEALAARFREALGDHAEADGMRVVEVSLPEAAGAALPATPPTDVPAPAASTPDVDADATVAGVAQARSPRALPEKPPPGAAAPAEAEGPATVIMADATLIIDGSGQDAGAPVEHRLAAFNYLGRAEGNQVRLTRGGVSRRHALIALVGARGYSIKDLRSQNGTFVNGERIEERMLADGDLITIGEARLTFRLSPR